MEPNSIEFLERMLDISRIMAENRELDSLLKFAMQAAMELVNAEQGHLILLNDAGRLEFRVSHGDPAEVSNSVVERVLRNRDPVRIMDAMSDTNYLSAASIQNFQLQSIMAVPLISRDKLLGAVYVENRSYAHIFSEEHLDVLNFFAKQAAVLIDNALLAAHLQQARAEIVTTRQEERRRIRRNLNSELGPSLAALRLELDTTQNLLLRDNETATKILDDMQGEVETILNKVRRIVYRLRPPALDQLGLISAIQEHISASQQQSNVEIEFHYPQQLPPLSAAIEVAIYRIVIEAVNNVIQHAQAQYCHIHLSIPKDVLMIIHDNGHGLDEETPTGMGIASMYKYVSELGGKFEISNDNGTKIEVYLPLVF